MAVGRNRGQRPGTQAIHIHETHPSSSHQRPPRTRTIPQISHQHCRASNRRHDEAGRRRRGQSPSDQHRQKRHGHHRYQDKKNPIEILVRAIENAAPAEDVTRIAYGGIVYPISVDIAPQRRVDIALRYITNLSRQASHNNPKTVDECLADELILAAARDPKSASVKKRDEIERIALASR